MIGATENTSIVTGNVHHAGYRKNPFLHNQVSYLNASIIYGVYTESNRKCAHSIANRIKMRPKVLYRVILPWFYLRSVQLQFTMYRALSLFVSRFHTSIYRQVKSRFSFLRYFRFSPLFLSLSLFLLRENNKFPAM